MLIDGYNFIHRAGYTNIPGEYATVFTFFRTLRSIVEELKPDKVILTLEGNPQFRYDLYPEYKANRNNHSNDLEKQLQYIDFKRQKNIIVSILCRLPIEVLKHPNYEGDDLLATIARKVYNNDICSVITGDTDFIQLYDEMSNIEIYNPIKKEVFARPEYNYLDWKCLSGDKSDNISGIPRIGAKTAVKILKSGLDAWLSEDIKRREIFDRNKKLIKFADVNLLEIETLNTAVDFDFIKNSFKQMEFNSLLTEAAWQKFRDTFEKL